MMIAQHVFQDIRGIRTWRLAIAFFAGVGGALLILDTLTIEKHKIMVAQGNGGQGVGEQWGDYLLLAWPIAHLLAVCLLAYAPIVWRCLRLDSMRMKSSHRRLKTSLGSVLLLVYAASMVISIGLGL